MTDSPRLAGVLLGVDMDHTFRVDGDWYSCSCGRWGGEAQRVGHVEFRAHVCDEQAAAILALEDSMTDSPRLEEVFAAVLAEHSYGGLHQFEAFVYCTCMAEFKKMDEWRAHVAERLAARFEQVGCERCDSLRAALDSAHLARIGTIDRLNECAIDRREARERAVRWEAIARQLGEALEAVERNRFKVWVDVRPALSVYRDATGE